jgi:hypothetical protein
MNATISFALSVPALAATVSRSAQSASSTRTDLRGVFGWLGTRLIVRTDPVAFSPCWWRERRRRETAGRVDLNDKRILRDVFDSLTGPPPRPRLRCVPAGADLES